MLLGCKFLPCGLNFFGTPFGVGSTRLHTILLHFKGVLTESSEVLNQVGRSEHLEDLDQVVISELELLHTVPPKILLTGSQQPGLLEHLCEVVYYDTEDLSRFNIFQNPFAHLV